MNELKQTNIKTKYLQPPPSWYQAQPNHEAIPPLKQKEKH